MQLPNYVENVINMLENNGFEAYAVGGCVRDSLRGIEPHDYDVTTSARPEQTKNVFEGFKVIETGMKHGTVTVLVDGNSIEITTFRIDGEYSDNRHPKKVLFTSKLENDLSRRDFTINAMAYSTRTGVVDLFGGKQDIENKIIRAVGDAEIRFEEDALRIMRALRFSAVCGYKIEESTAKAIHVKKELLKNISGERIADEMNKLLCGDCGKLLREFSDVFAVIIPEIRECVGFLQHSKYHDRDVWEHTVAAVEAIEPERNLRFAMLLHDLGKPACYVNENGVGHFKGHAAVSKKICQRVMSELKYDRETADKITLLVERHDIPMGNDEKTVRHRIAQFGEKTFFELLKIHIADDSAKSPQYQNRIEGYKLQKDYADKIIAENSCLSLKKLAVNGNDLIKLGYSGKAVGEALKLLLDAVIDEKCNNVKENLLKYLELNG